MWIQSVPPLVVYLTIGGVIGLESLGIPIPGEIALVAATLLTVSGHSTVQWEFIAIAASAGAIIGDSIGYAIGHKFGKSLFTWLGKKLPRHFGPEHLAVAERAFQRWGMWAVFFGRFIAVLRIFAGPLAGALKMPYHRFFIANALGGITWAAGTAAAIHYIGRVAEEYLRGFSLVGLGVAVVVGIAFSLFLKYKTTKHAKQIAAEQNKQEAAVEPAEKL